MLRGDGDNGCRTFRSPNERHGAGIPLRHMAGRVPILPNIGLGLIEQHRIVVRGGVDGVAFRVWVKNVARSLQLMGHVRFVEPGVCEVLAQGNRFALRQFVATCRRGPCEGVVESVTDEREPLEKHLFEFALYR